MARIKRIQSKVWRFQWILGLAISTFLLVIGIIPGFAADQLPKRNVPSPQLTNLLAQGKNQFDAGRLSEAAESWQQAAQTYKTQKDSLNQALSLSYLSLAYQDLGDWDQAESAINQSLTLLKSNAQITAPQITPVLAQALNTQGSLQLSMGHPEKALESWKQAKSTYQEIDDEVGIIGSQINQAQAFQTMGFYHRAQTTLKRVDKQLQNQPASPLKSVGLRSLGGLLRVTGDLEQSQQVLEQSLAIAQQFNLPGESSAALFSLGNTHRAAQNFDLALQFYQQAAATAPNPLNQIEAQINRLSLLVETQQEKQANPTFPKLRDQLNQLSPSRTAIYARVNLAENWMKSEQSHSRPTAHQTPSLNVQSVAQLLADAVQQAQELKDLRAESFALGQLGALYENNQQWPDAQNLTNNALGLAQISNAQDLTYRWQWQLGRIFNGQSERKEAISAYADAIETLSLVRGDLVASSSEVQYSFQERIEPVYREMVQLLLQTESPRQKISQENLKLARKILEEQQLAELEDFFRSACLEANPQQIDTLDSNAAVFYPIILPDRLEVIVAFRDQPFHHHSVLIPETELTETLNQLLQLFNPAASDKKRLQVSKQVYDWLIQPSEAVLTQNQIETIVFVPQGALRNLPLAGLYDGQRYLIEKYGVALTPGLQLLESRRPLESDQSQALMLGLTESRQGFPPLPAVETEVNQIASELSADIFLNEAFTKTNLENQLRNSTSPILHLATHGQFGSSPQETFLLAWDQKINLSEMDSLLQLRPDAKSRAIELLVLSACQTATGDERATLGLAGLAVRSGARSTLATLWSVQDNSTALFMTQFYQALLKPATSRAEGLRQAQLALLKDESFQHPFYWAPFVLVGNWLT